MLSFCEFESRHCVMAICVKGFYSYVEVGYVKKMRDINLHNCLFVFGD